MEKIIIGATEMLHGHKTQTQKNIMNNNHSYSLFTTKLIVSLDFIHKKKSHKGSCYTKGVHRKGGTLRAAQSLMRLKKILEFDWTM